MALPCALVAVLLARLLRAFKKRFAVSLVILSKAKYPQIKAWIFRYAQNDKTLPLPCAFSFDEKAVRSAFMALPFLLAFLGGLPQKQSVKRKRQFSPSEKTLCV